MRSRDVQMPGHRGNFRASTFKYGPAYLLMHQGAPWRWLSEGQVGPAIGRALPEERRQGWHILHRGLMTADNESAAAR
eukprot:3646239-Alexandrium_andersonii.AAC.1